MFKLGNSCCCFLKNIHTKFLNKKKSLPVYVQCIPSWGIPAPATQTKTAETNTERNSIAASLFLHAEHWHLTETFSLYSNCEWREVLKSLQKTPRALSQQPQSDRTTALCRQSDCLIWDVYLNKAWVDILSLSLKENVSLSTGYSTLFAKWRLQVITSGKFPKEVIHFLCEDKSWSLIFDFGVSSNMSVDKEIKTKT